MEVPGKLASCDLCKAQNKSTEADGFCVDCDEYMCQACFATHALLKRCRNHVLSATDEGKTKQVHTEMKTEKCQLHQEEIVKYYCRSHDVIACVDCVVISHRSCKVELIREISRNVRESSGFKDLLSKIQQLEADIKAYDKQRKINQKANNALLDKVVGQIRQFRKELNDYLDNAEKEIFEEAKQLSKENEKKMSILEEEINGTMQNISELINTLDSKFSPDEIMFILLIQCKPKVREIELTLSDVQHMAYIKPFAFERDKFLQDLLKTSPKMGSLKMDQHLQIAKRVRESTLVERMSTEPEQSNRRMESTSVRSTPSLETQTKKRLYMPPDSRAHGFYVGTRVESWAILGNKWEKGTVTKVHPGGYVDVKLDDFRFPYERVYAGANGNFQVRLLSNF